MAAFAAGRPYYGALKPQAARRIDDGHGRSDERPKRRLNPATARRKSTSKGDFEPHGRGIWRGTSRNCTFRRQALDLRRSSDHMRATRWYTTTLAAAAFVLGTLAAGSGTLRGAWEPPAFRQPAGCAQAGVGKRPVG